MQTLFKNLFNLMNLFGISLFVISIKIFHKPSVKGTLMYRKINFLATSALCVFWINLEYSKLKLEGRTQYFRSFSGCRPPRLLPLDFIYNLSDYQQKNPLKYNVLPLLILSYEKVFNKSLISP